MNLKKRVKNRLIKDLTDMVQTGHYNTVIMERFKILFVIFVPVFVIFVSNVLALNRTALVIGNAAYKVSPLTNPINDATDMASALKEKGFDVTFKINVTQKTMERAIRKFGKNLRNGGIGLFYYAGHGIQIKGNNYLIPIGSIIESEADVKYEAVDAGLVLAKMEDAENDLNIVILDACRNNPFVRSFRSSTMGLARMDAPKGSLIAYATAPDSLAADGEGRNGIYTKHLIRNIQKPEIKIEQVFKNVRVAVVSETSNKQVPWEASSLMGTFYFDPQQTGQNNIEQVVVKKQPADNSDERLFWESIKDSKNVNMFEAYLRKFPNGMFLELADINIQKYIREQLEREKRQLNELLLKYTPKHPKVIELVKSVVDLKKRLKDKNY
jgi:hypothetical protein